MDVEAAFLLRVRPEPDDVLNAARALGERGVREDNVRLLVTDALVWALRAAAAPLPLAVLDRHRDQFAAAVRSLLVKDFQENGLTLESVTILSLRPTPGSGAG